MFTKTYEDGTKLIHPTCPDGTILFIEGDFRRYVTNSVGLSMIRIEERLKDGWGNELATTLGRNFVTKDGGIYYLYNRKGKEIYISYEDIKKADVELALDVATIGKRLGKGYSVEEALTRPIDRRYVGTFKVLGNVFESMKKRERERSREAIQQMRERKFREEKPHLFDGTPQQHTKGKWCEHLMQNDIFPKVVK